jgi:hypothetical protein
VHSGFEKSQKLALEEQKKRAEELESRRAKLEARERELAEAEKRLHIEQRAAAELHNRIEQRWQEVALNEQLLEPQIERLAQLRAELEALHNVFDAAQEQAEARQQTLAAQLAAEQAQLDERHKELARQTEQLTQQRRDIEQAEARLEQDRRELHDLREALATERRQFQEQVASGLASDAERLAELERLNDAALAEAHQQRGELERQISQQLQELSARADALTEAQQSIQELKDEIQALRANCAQLTDELEQAHQQIGQSDGASGGNAADSDLEQRYQMALDDLRAEKARVADLERKLAQGGGRQAVSAAGGGNDWESMKKRMMEQLDQDFSEDDPQQAEERLKIEEVIRDTDRIVAEKDREIAELRQLLEEQSSSWGSMAVGAAAIADVLDKDEIIQHERENLKKTQEEWREKMRQAEIDISMERAKIARERAELDEKLRVLQEQSQRGNAEPNAQGKDKSKDKPQRGRWLTRLGLKDQDE